MPQVIFTIDEQGQTEVKVQGVAGKGCQDLTEQVIKELGTVVTSDKTPEYNARVQQGQSQGQGAGQAATNRSR